MPRRGARSGCAAAALLVASLAAPASGQEVTVASSAGQLQQSILAGAQHIEITAHLDLTTLDRNILSKADNPDLFRPLTSTRSIRGNCGEDTPIPGFMAANPPPLALQPGQCYLRAPFQAFFWNNGINSLWFDSISMAGVETADTTLLMRWTPQPASKLWVTNAAFSGAPRVTALFVGDSPTVISSTSFALTAGFALSINNANVAIDGASFVENSAPQAAEGVLEVDGVSNVRLTASSFSGTVGNDVRLESTTATLLSDTPAANFTVSSTGAGSIVPLTANSTVGLTFLDLDDPDLAAIRTDIESFPRVAGPLPPSDGGSDLPIGLGSLIGIAIGGLALIIAIVLCVLYRKRIRACSSCFAAGGKDVHVPVEAVSAESPRAVERRRQKRREVYEKGQAITKERRIQATVTIHSTPSAMASGMHSHMGAGVPVHSVSTADKEAPPEQVGDIGDIAEAVGGGGSDMQSVMSFAASPPRRGANGKAKSEASPGKNGAAPLSGMAGGSSMGGMNYGMGMPPSMMPASSGMSPSMMQTGMTPSMMQSGVSPSMLYGSQPGSGMSHVWQSQLSGQPTLFVTREAKDKLNTALDGMALAQPPALFADAYHVLVDRMPGRQALVCFAVSADGSLFQHAIKFFHTYKDFRRESEIVSHARLRTTVPPAFAANENLDAKAPGGILAAPNGFKFPPFLVLERGVTLADWQQRQPLSFALTINMLYEVAQLLQTAHGVGRVHRDVHPENLLLMVQSQAWKVSDYGVAASIGKRKKISPHCALTFAAPEAVRAFEDERALAVHASQDIWSLAVTAYTCLVGDDVFDESAGMAAVSQHARGKAHYPWEAGHMHAEWAKCPAQPLLQPCLSRDPTSRPSAGELLRSIDAFVKANVKKSFMV